MVGFSVERAGYTHDLEVKYLSIVVSNDQMIRQLNWSAVQKGDKPKESRTALKCVEIRLNL